VDTEASHLGLMNTATGPNLFVAAVRQGVAHELRSAFQSAALLAVRVIQPSVNPKLEGKLRATNSTICSPRRDVTLYDCSEEGHVRSSDASVCLPEKLPQPNQRRTMSVHSILDEGDAVAGTRIREQRQFSGGERGLRSTASESETVRTLGPEERHAIATQGLPELDAAGPNSSVSRYRPRVHLLLGMPRQLLPFARCATSLSKSDIVANSVLEGAA
jgi:hypothetical protein